MPAIRLETRRVEKPWGRRDLWPGFDDVPAGEAPVGEIWFQVPGMAADEPELLVKYLFTGERLSIQVHPDDAAARRAGYPRGKDEAWVVLDAQPHAAIAMGTQRVMDRAALRAAAQDGSIEELIDWKAVKVGDVYYSPAGTVHAIGAGLTLVEVQQNVDLTYRLHDYGRPRALHLEEGVAVAHPVPYVATCIAHERGRPGHLILADGPAFVLERWRWQERGTLAPAAGRPVWLVALAGSGVLDGQALTPGAAWLVDAPVALEMGEGSDLLIAYPAAGVIDTLWQPETGADCP